VRFAYTPLLIVLLDGCRSDAPAPPAPIDPLADSPGLTLAIDRNPDPNVFEMDLVAKPATVEYTPGIKTQAWTYNGTVPGPLVDVKVGDTFIAHFKNELPESTTIHWHGIRLPNAMDGSTAVQSPVKPGGTFEYKFTFKDPGLYWFHPHHRSDEQTERGLYGVIRVRRANEPTSDREHVLVLDDARVGKDGSLPDDLADYEKLPMTMKLHGRTGDTILVNGIANRTLELQAGAIHRFRLLNTANLRFFNLRVPGFSWRVIGTDGGLFEKPYDTTNLLIGPAERYDALLIPAGAVGTELVVKSDAYARAEDDPQDAFDVMRFRISNEQALVGKKLPDALPGVAPAKIEVPPGEPMPIVFDFGTQGGSEGYTLPLMSMDDPPMTIQPGDPIFVINKKAGSDIPPIDMKLGETRVFKVSNLSHQIHLFHLHGAFFQVVDTDDRFDAKINPAGYKPEFLSQVLKDTIVVRSGYSVTVVARFDEPGKWMYHCHIPEHSERGMMAEMHIAP